MKKWDLLEQYEKQDERLNQMKREYLQKEREAKEHVENLKAQYSALIQRELREGKNLDAEKSKLRQQIVDAEKAAELAAQERSEVFRFIDDEHSQADRITIADLAHDWLSNYVPAVRAEEVEPILERMRAARAEYLNAAMDLLELDDEYRALHSRLQEMVNVYYRSGKHGARPHIPRVIDGRSIPTMSGEELHNLQEYRRLPHDVKRVTN